MITVTRVNTELVIDFGEPEMLFKQSKDYDDRKPYMRKFHFINYKDVDPNSPLHDALSCFLVDAHKDDVLQRWIVEEFSYADLRNDFLHSGAVSSVEHDDVPVVEDLVKEKTPAHPKAKQA